MDKETVIYNINRLIEIYRIRKRISDGLYKTFGVDYFEEGCCDEIFQHATEMVWDMILAARNFPEIAEEEFDVFAEVIYDMACADKKPYTTFTIKNEDGREAIYPINSSEDLYEVFTNGDSFKNYI